MHAFIKNPAFRAGLAALACCFALSGCTMPAGAGDSTASPAPTAAATAALAPSPSPSPSPASDADIALRARAAFNGHFKLNYDKYDTGQEIATFAELMELRHLFTGMADDYEAAVSAAANAALAAAREFDPDAALGLTCPEADWRFMVALCCDCAETADAKLLRLSGVDVAYENGALAVNVALPRFEAFFENEAPDVQYNALTIYCYLNTVYNEDGSETNSDGAYAFPEGYAETLAEPLPKRHIKEGWYDERSDATRHHMGTDITAPEGRIIHACGAGTVLYIGWTDIAGNYVMILDDYGFRFTYCHMVERTKWVEVGDRVEAGQVIGNVGDTGNSDAPHLHLSIITPEHRYVDPYPLVAEIRELARG